MLSWFARTCVTSQPGVLYWSHCKGNGNAPYIPFAGGSKQAKKLLPTNTVTLPRTNIAPETKVSGIPKRESSFPSSIFEKNSRLVLGRGFFPPSSTPWQQLLPTLYTFTGGTKSIKSLWWRCFYGAGSKVFVRVLGSLGWVPVFRHPKVEKEEPWEKHDLKPMNSKCLLICFYLQANHCGWLTMCWFSRYC